MQCPCSVPGHPAGQDSREVMTMARLQRRLATSGAGEEGPREGTKVQAGPQARGRTQEPESEGRKGEELGPRGREWQERSRDPRSQCPRHLRLASAEARRLGEAAQAAEEGGRVRGQGRLGVQAPRRWPHAPRADGRQKEPTSAQEETEGISSAGRTGRHCPVPLLSGKQAAADGQDSPTQAGPRGPLASGLLALGLRGCPQKSNPAGQKLCSYSHPQRARPLAAGAKWAAGLGPGGQKVLFTSSLGGEEPGSPPP